MERCVLLWVFIPLILFENTFGCTPAADGEEPSLDKSIYYSDVVVYGNAKRQLNDPMFGHIPTAYMVEFEVLCSYKGGEFPQLINITGAGNRSDLCFNTNLQPGMSYVVLLNRRAKGLFEPTYSELNGDVYFEELLFICDLRPEYPIGVTKNTAKEECPPIESECISYVPVTDATTTMEERGYGDNTKDTDDDDEDDTHVEDVDVQAVGSDNTKDSATELGLSLAVALICLTVISLLV